jgi:predicted alpha/beta hydrolase
MRRKLYFLIAAIPVCHLCLGYYPGRRIGFGDDEARSVMDDWRALARHNRYHASGLDENLDARIAGYSSRVLAIRLADDPFAPEASVEAVTRKFVSARLTEKTLDADTLGERADHVRWARSPVAVTRVIRDWSGAFV